VLWFQGRPGSGKSVLMAELCARLLEAGQLGGAHFFNFKYAKLSDLFNIITSIAFQLAARLPTYRKLLLDKLAAFSDHGRLREHYAKDEAFAFVDLVRNPLAACRDEDWPGRGRGRQRLVVLLDALDEMDSQASRTRLVKLLRDEDAHLPPWLGFIVSSRPESDIVKARGPTEKRKPAAGGGFADVVSVDDASAATLRSDLHRYLAHKLRQLAPPPTELQGAAAAAPNRVTNGHRRPDPRFPTYPHIKT
jgi:hypothetical protein